jgi:hypothetical protein
MKIDELGEPEIRNVLRWVRYLLVTLRCSQWTVLLETECLAEPGPDDEDYVHASVHTHSENNIAVLQLGHKWGEVSAGERRHTLVHEMLHLATKDWDRVGSLWASRVPRQGGVALMQLGEASERTIDHLAFCLAPLLPQYDADTLLPEGVGNDLLVSRLNIFWDQS